MDSRLGSALNGDMTLALDHIAGRRAVGSAMQYVHHRDEETLASQIELSEIPAPPFEEAARATRMAGMMEEAGLRDVRTDEVGNVVADSDHASDDPPLIVAAHLDTIFPAGTDVSVTRAADVLRGPGISDDARGLAVLLALARALDDAEIRTRRPLLFVATVGEEGAGDLRGVKYLFGPTGEGRTGSAFISVDGGGLERIVIRGLGSRRFRIVARGPGGHSWVDWGIPNPIHALATVAAELTALDLPSEPPTTLTVARWGGGKSINAIPQEAWIELDTRSESGDRLEDLEATIRDCVARHSISPFHDLSFEVVTIGRRPAGATAAGDPLVAAAFAATRNQGKEPLLAASSTDANIPMSMGIPAITIGGGGEAGQAHTTGEWYRNREGPEGVIRALLTVLLAAGVAD